MSTLKKEDIFESLDMGEYIWGNAFLFDVSDLNMISEKVRFDILNEICKSEGWEQLDDTWNSMNFADCAQLLMDSIEFDIAYSSCRITPEDQAKMFHEALLRDFDPEKTNCYSNWFGNHWRTENGVGSWNNLTENTFDLGVVFVNDSQLLITCFRSED